jgi:hypothetical protein
LLTRQFPLLEAVSGEGAEAGGEAVSGVATLEAPAEPE